MTGHCHVVDFNMLKTMETETKKLETYQLLSTNKAAQRSPFLAVYEPGSGGLVLNSA